MTYSYDAGDRVTSIADSVNGTIARGYDDLDRLTSETTPQGTMAYTYDAAGRRSTATVTGQPAVSYGYDAANRLTSVTQGTATVGLAYDLAGRRSSLTLPNGVVTTYGYDAADALTSLSGRWAATRSGISRTATTWPAGGSTVGGSFARTNIPPALTAATYDLGNRLLTWDGTSYTYDLNGNLTGDGTTTYTWNARNQLTAIAGGASGGFTYDAVGRRTSRAVGGVTTNYLYDGVDAVQEQIGGSPSANYLLGLGIDERFTRTDGTGTVGYLVDALGSTVALADAAGAVATTYTYEPYGVTTQGGVGSANPARYTGREEDGTGLDHDRARYYDPRRQRFVSEDPLEFRGGGSNLHVYGLNAPTRFSDPTGLVPFLPPPECRGGRKMPWWQQFLCVQIPLIPDLIVPFPPALGAEGGGGGAAAAAEGSGAGADAAAASRAARASRAVQNLSRKILRQMGQRNWTADEIEEAISSGEEFPAPNNINPGNGATRYVNPSTGQSVVVDNSTGEVIHAGGPGFKDRGHPMLRWLTFLSPDLASSAYLSPQTMEPAWNRADVLRVLDQLESLAIPVLGVEVWLPSDSGPFVPTSPYYGTALDCDSRQGKGDFVRQSIRRGQRICRDVSLGSNGPRSQGGITIL